MDPVCKAAVIDICLHARRCAYGNPNFGWFLYSFSNSEWRYRIHTCILRAYSLCHI